MCKRPRVQVVPDLADKSTIGSEFQKLRGARSIGRSSGVSTREHKDVASGVDGYASNFSEIEVRREFEKVGYRAIADFGNGRLLRPKGTHQEQQRKDRALHGGLQSRVANIALSAAMSVRQRPCPCLAAFHRNPR